MKKLRVLVLMHHYQVPPDDVTGHDLATASWRTEYDVLKTLRDELEHDVHVLGVKDDLGGIRQANEDFKPHIAFNLLEAFHEVGTFDQNVVSYLELLRLPYTGCNPRGMLLARDKALSKKLLQYHRIGAPDFTVVSRGQKARLPRRLPFPVIVKSLTQEASIGISQASVVEDEGKLRERVHFIHESIATDAIVEQFVEGRELYCGVMGNQRVQVLPVWEMTFAKMPDDQHRIATERVKWSPKYQQKMGIATAEARELPAEKADQVRHVSKRVYKVLQLSGYARIDLRLDVDGRLYVLEANPNPQIARNEDFAESALKAGLTYPALLQRILSTGLRWEPERLDSISLSRLRRAQSSDTGRARQLHLGKRGGAMADKGITRNELVKKLNEDLSREYQAIIAYVVYSQVLKGAEYMAIADELEIHAAEELKHALAVAKHIDYLGGMPTVTPKPVKQSKDAREMLRADLNNEMETIRHYRQRLRECETIGEYAIAEDIREILRNEQEHLIDLATALGEDVPDMSDKGPPAAKKR